MTCLHCKQNVGLVQKRGDGSLNPVGRREGMRSGYVLKAEPTASLTDWMWGLKEREVSRMTLRILVFA